MSRPCLAVLALVACQQLSTTEGVEPRPPEEPSAYQLLDAKPSAVLAGVSERAVVPARAALREPAEPAAPPSLSSRASDGKPELDFALQHTSVRARVSGPVARVEVTQLYRNPTSERLEAVYRFPLPANAAVTDMYFRIGDRVVYSQVQRREQAKRTYETAKSEGKTAALTEQERPNLFTQSVANVPPGESVAVVIRYAHEVPLDDGRYQLVFPTTVGPRYSPAGVTDVPRITSPAVGKTVHSAADVDITVQLVPGVAFADVAAKSHRVVTGLDGEGARLVALDEGDRLPNKDFVLSWAPAGAAPTAHALTELDRGEPYLMMLLQPPAQVEQRLVRPKELVFLVDTSCSMGGQPLDTAKALIDRALGQLGPEDTFQLIGFASSTVQMSEAPLLNTPANVAAAKRWLGGMSSGGGTEMMKGIWAALAPPADPRRLRMVVFCTDGFIGNEQEILDATRRYRDQARVFGFGIGSSVNRWLIEGLGREGRGASDVVGFDEKLEAVVDRLYRRLDRPVLTDLKLEFRGVEVRERYPEALPDLMAGQPLVVVGRLTSAAKAGTVVLSGRYAGEPWAREVPFEVSRADTSGRDLPVLGTLWARRKVDALSWRTSGGPGPDEVEAITELGLKFKLITPYTSFVAVERQLLVDPKLPLTQMLVPNELPEGVKWEGVLGDASDVQVLPSRVKPGDPELRVRAAASARAVRVKLPFGGTERLAERDPASGEFVLRFLVPSGWPDGSFEVAVAIEHRDGRVERRTSKVRVDTTASAVLVLSADPLAVPGRPFTLSLKPALALSELSLDADALKAAMETKEVLVHAPWGETVRARQEGVLGAYVATVHVPEDARGTVRLELVSSDAAGNVYRRGYALPLASRYAEAWWGLALVALVGGAWLARRGAARA